MFLTKCVNCTSCWWSIKIFYKKNSDCLHITSLFLCSKSRLVLVPNYLRCWLWRKADQTLSLFDLLLLLLLDFLLFWLFRSLYLSTFFKMGHPWPLFHFFGLFKQTVQILQQINVKSVHLVSGAGIRTHNLLILSLLL